MSVSMEIKKAEAIKRMQALNLYTPYINCFKKSSKIFLSEMTGGVYEFDDDKELIAKVRAFEIEHDALVYHIIHNHSLFGDMWSFLYVSDHEDEWYMDNNDIKEGRALVYVWNRTAEWCSEFGSIGVKGRYGGIIRTF